jgi:hypothetical protein
MGKHQKKEKTQSRQTGRGNGFRLYSHHLIQLGEKKGDGRRRIFSALIDWNRQLQDSNAQHARLAY